MSYLIDTNAPGGFHYIDDVKGEQVSLFLLCPSSPQEKIGYINLHLGQFNFWIAAVLLTFGLCFQAVSLEKL